MALLHPPLLREAHEYDGQREVAIACTQLGAAYTATRARRIVDEWIVLLAQPTPLRELQFTTRTPKRLFAAVADQPQLLRLSVKWGDYSDLTSLETLTNLQELSLRGASAVSDLRTLAALQRLEVLSIEGFRTIEDPSPLGKLTGLRELELGGAWMTPRNGHISTVAFLRELPNVETLLLHTLVVDDLDYEPLLHLPKLRSVRVMKVRGMRPSHEELQRRIPWSE